MTTTRNCLDCVHCTLDMGTADYSELTPGEPAEWTCRKGHWSFDSLEPIDKRAARKARDCPDYKPEAWAHGDEPDSVCFVIVDRNHRIVGTLAQPPDRAPPKSHRNRNVFPVTRAVHEVVKEDPSLWRCDRQGNVVGFVGL